MGNGFTESGVKNDVPGMGDDRLKPPYQSVFALCTGIEVLEPKGQCKLDALVVTGFKVKKIVIFKTTPIAAIQCGVSGQKQGAGNHFALPYCHDQVQVLRKCFTAVLKEGLVQIGRLAS